MRSFPLILALLALNAPADARPNAKLQAVRRISGTELQILGSGPPNFSATTQREPFSVIVDWAGLKIGPGVKSQRFSKGLIRAVQVEARRFESEPVARLVVTLAAETSFDVDTKDGELRLRFVPVDFVEPEAKGAATSPTRTERARSQPQPPAAARGTRASTERSTAVPQEQVKLAAAARARISATPAPALSQRAPVKRPSAPATRSKPNLKRTKPSRRAAAPVKIPERIRAAERAAPAAQGPISELATAVPSAAPRPERVAARVAQTPPPKLRGSQPRSVGATRPGKQPLASYTPKFTQPERLARYAPKKPERLARYEPKASSGPAELARYTPKAAPKKTALAHYEAKASGLDRPNFHARGRHGLHGLGFQQLGVTSRVHLQLNRAAAYRQFMRGNSTFVLELEDTAPARRSTLYPLDTRYFNGAVTGIQAVRRGQKLQIRIQLRRLGPWRVRRDGSDLFVEFD